MVIFLDLNEQKNNNKSDENNLGKYFLSSLVLAEPTINRLVSGWGGERHVCNVRAELSNLGANTPYTCGQKQLSFGQTKIQMFIANLRRGTQILRIGVNV